MFRRKVSGISRENLDKTLLTRPQNDDVSEENLLNSQTSVFWVK